MPRDFSFRCVKHRRVVGRLADRTRVALIPVSGRSHQLVTKASGGVVLCTLANGSVSPTTCPSHCLIASCCRFGPFSSAPLVILRGATTCVKWPAETAGIRADLRTLTHSTGCTETLSELDEYDLPDEPPCCGSSVALKSSTTCSMPPTRLNDFAPTHFYTSDCTWTL